jgi:hypothetical protein
MQKRNRSKPHSFENKIAAEKARAEAQLAGITHGPERDALAQKIRQLDTASHLNEWLSSPGLRQPD